MPKEILTAQRFMLGIVCGLRLNGVTKLPYNEECFGIAAKVVFGAASTWAYENGLAVSFNIRIGQVYPGSHTAFLALKTLQDEVRLHKKIFVNPETYEDIVEITGIGLLLDEETAYQLLATLPIREVEFWRQQARHFHLALVPDCETSDETHLVTTAP